MHFLYRPLGDDSPEDLKHRHHTEGLLNDHSFPVAAIRAVLPRGEKGGKKVEIAALAAQRAVEAEGVARSLALGYARQPRSWLALYNRSEPETLQPKRASHLFILEHGRSEDCFGPIHDESSGSTYYLITRSVPQWTVDDPGEPPVRAYLRWTCVAEITPTYVALHWDNFQYRGEGQQTTRRHQIQYPYWNEIEAVQGTLVGLGAGTLDAPAYVPLVLHNLWGRYVAAPDFEWTHERIRAQAEGVALTASGRRQSDAVELDVTGIEALTRRLAEAAVEECGASTDAIARVSRRLLHMVIKGWNPRSYQFRLDESGADETRVFRGHVYFGSGPFAMGSTGGEAARVRRSGPDAIPHVRCFSRYGGSLGARDFLLRHLSAP